jgi:hypothetical protein
MKNKGKNIVGTPSELDIADIIYKKPIIKKYTLATLVNYSIRFFGKKSI